MGFRKLPADLVLGISYPNSNIGGRSWRRVTTEVWGGLFLFFSTRYCFLDSSGLPSFSYFKLEAWKYSWKFGSLGTELETVTMPPSHDSSSVRPCPCHHLRKKMLMDKSEDRGVWVSGKMEDLNCPLLLLTPSAVS